MSGGQFDTPYVCFWDYMAHFENQKLGFHVISVLPVFVFCFFLINISISNNFISFSIWSQRKTCTKDYLPYILKMSFMILFLFLEIIYNTIH